LERRVDRSYNFWFILPFAVWFVTGVLLHFTYGRVAVFRLINGHNSLFLDGFMYNMTWLGTAQVIVPLLFLPIISARYRNWWYLSLAAACNVAPFLVVQILKSTFNAHRPMHYFEGNSWIHILEQWDRIFTRSFPSGHSEGAFSLFCFFSLLLPSKYRFVGLLFFLAAATVGYSRVYLTAHFAEDVLAGGLVGVVFTIAAHELMNRKVKRYFRSTT
jgi:membrane-associated phospholipid phosphatase